MIKKSNGGYIVYSEDGKKLSREYTNKEDAIKRLKQIEYYKRKSSR